MRVLPAQAAVARPLLLTGALPVAYAVQRPRAGAVHAAPRPSRQAAGTEPVVGADERVPASRIAARPLYGGPVSGALADEVGARVGADGAVRAQVRRPFPLGRGGPGAPVEAAVALAGEAAAQGAALDGETVRLAGAGPLLGAPRTAPRAAPWRFREEGGAPEGAAGAGGALPCAALPFVVAGVVGRAPFEVRPRADATVRRRLPNPTWPDAPPRLCQLFSRAFRQLFGLPRASAGVAGRVCGAYRQDAPAGPPPPCLTQGGGPLSSSPFHHRLKLKLARVRRQALEE